jgi:phosphoglycolate phosphatase
MDGTVIDSTEAILESFKVSFERHQDTQRDEEAIKALIGFPLETMYIRLGVSKSVAMEYVATYKKYYRSIAKEKTVLLKGAREAIIEASTFARLGVVTTKTGKYTKEILEHMGLLEYFETVVGFEDVSQPKPDAEPILTALNRMSHSNEAVWMIGDTHMDIISAKNAKVDAVAVTCGYESKEALQKISNHVTNNVYEAVHYIKTLSK